MVRMIGNQYCQCGWRVRSIASTTSLLECPPGVFDVTLMRAAGKGHDSPTQPIQLPIVYLRGSSLCFHFNTVEPPLRRISVAPKAGPDVFKALKKWAL